MHESFSVSCALQSINIIVCEFHLPSMNDEAEDSTLSKEKSHRLIRQEAIRFHFHESVSVRFIAFVW